MDASGTTTYTNDAKGNIYVAGGLGLNVIPASGRLATGTQLARQVAKDNCLGLEWQLDLTKREEYEPERDLTGFSAGISGRLIVGLDANATVRREPAAANLELGFYTPQVAVGGSYGLLLYDANSPTPWPRQCWWNYTAN